MSWLELVVPVAESEFVALLRFNIKKQCCPPPKKEQKMFPTKRKGTKRIAPGGPPSPQPLLSDGFYRQLPQVSTSRHATRSNRRAGFNNVSDEVRKRGWQLLEHVFRMQNWGVPFAALKYDPSTVAPERFRGSRFNPK